MYRLVIFGAQVQCENVADVLALIRATQRTVVVKKRRRRVRPGRTKVTARV